MDDVIGGDDVAGNRNAGISKPRNCQRTRCRSDDGKAGQQADGQATPLRRAGPLRLLCHQFPSAPLQCFLFLRPSAALRRGWFQCCGGHGQATRLDQDRAHAWQPRFATHVPRRAWSQSVRHPYQRELLWRRRSFSRITAKIAHGGPPILTKQNEWQILDAKGMKPA